MTPAAAQPDAPAGAAPAPLPARTGPPRHLPRQTSLTLGPITTAPRTARATLTATLTVWGLGHLQDSAETITSELVTNAINASTQAAPPGIEPRPVTLEITADRAELLIRVWDPDPVMPPPGDPDPLAEDGRGLILVSALSHRRWGWHPARNGGKWVWAAVPTANPSLTATATNPAQPPPRTAAMPQPRAHPRPAARRPAGHAHHRTDPPAGA